MLAADDAALFEFKKEDDGRWVVVETHYMHNKIVREGRSGPPLHIHLQQTEYFEVQQGVLGVVKNGQEYKLTADSGTVSIPPGTRHRFWAHASGTKDLVFKCWVHPQDLDHSFDESFLRNFVGYIRDCQKAKIEPSIFQLVLLGYNSATVSCPPFWVPIWILTAIHYVLAYWIAAGLLGYEPSYPEYSESQHSSMRSKKSP